MRKGSKPTNPKDIIGSTKIDLGNVPDSMRVHAAAAFLEGALKYGRFNWRIAGVRASIYHAALIRHVAKWWAGQDRDPVTRVRHLANALACIAIILDAEIYGKLNDDRPPCPDPDAMARLIDGQTVNVAFLKALFKTYNPKQYTIHDTNKVQARPRRRQKLKRDVSKVPVRIPRKAPARKRKVSR